MNLQNLIIAIIISFLLMVQPAVSQTVFQGKILSVDGTPIPKAAISIQPEIRRDIFSDHYEDILTDEDGSYQFTIKNPGLFRLYYKGVFHQSISLPIMVYDQPSITMNILLMPKYFNDGLYFSQDDYTEWIRVYGNFNDYNYNTGKKFSLNPDGSISAYIPVSSDTIRYQVSGLTYGRGTSVLPQADEYQVREDGSFESVLYNDLPNDFLEIRYDPGKTIPFTRQYPIGVDPLRINLSGFISLKDQEDENWIRPLDLLQPYRKEFNFAPWEMAEGIPVDSQTDIQREYAGDLFFIDLSKELERVRTDLGKDTLHPQQKVLLSISYASVLSWMARKHLFQQMRSERLNQPAKQTSKIKHDSELLLSIPELVPPFHPAWRYNNGAAEYLLTETEDNQKLIEYFHEAVRVHPDERAVNVIALAMIRHLGSGYTSVEEMSVYQLIIERYGVGDLARNAHQAFIAQRN